MLMITRLIGQPQHRRYEKKGHSIPASGQESLSWANCSMDKVPDYSVQIVWDDETATSYKLFAVSGNTDKML